MGASNNLQRGRPGSRLELSERWMRVLSLIADAGPNGYQRSVSNFSDDVSVPVSSLTAILRRMAELNVIRIAKGGSVIGHGTMPSRYTALVTPEEWRERAHGVVAEHLAKKAAERKSAPRKKAAATKKAARSAALKAGDPQIERVIAEVRQEMEPELSAVFGEDPIDVDAWALPWVKD